MSTSLAASTRSVPLGTVTLLPSMVSVTVSGPFGRTDSALSAGAAAAAGERGWGDWVGSWPGTEAWLPGGAAPLLRSSSSGTGRDHLVFDRAAVLEAVLLVFAAEVPHRRMDDKAGRVAKRAQAAAVLQALLDGVENAELHLASTPLQDPVVGAQRPVAAHPAGSALAAGLGGVE